jgi:hypothetical protein
MTSPGTLGRTRLPAFGLLLVGCLAIAAQARANVSYSGRAFGARVKLVSPLPTPLTFSDTGPLPSTGGSLSATLLEITVEGILQSYTITASTSGAAGQAESSASQENVVVLPGESAEVTAQVVRASSQADCSGATGSSVIVGLTFGGQSIQVSGQPNQAVTIPDVATLVINEQIVTPGVPAITVNALHLTLLSGLEVILSSAHSDMSCPTPARSSTWARVKAIYR